MDSNDDHPANKFQTFHDDSMDDEYDDPNFLASPWIGNYSDLMAIFAPSDEIIGIRGAVYLVEIVTAPGFYSTWYVSPPGFLRGPR